MPEERTVSRFTRTDSTDRASQDARTIVQQTKIYQHNQREWRKANKLCLKQCRQRTWRNCGFLHPETEDGLNILSTIDTGDLEDDVPSHFLQPATLKTQRDGVDITLPFFRHLLSDEPVPGAEAIRSLPDWSESGFGTEGAREPSGMAVWDGAADKMVF
ncbi:hypothetical protein C8R44DRAFT_753311 [Mycena epipterygia]|nr:hypothetical protein C8R44DRAFT_753311 [Mycena epipterygia]